MTDVSNLDELASEIASSSPKIRNYALAQAAATQSQELDIQAGVSSRVMFVRPDGDDGKSGLNWANAKKTPHAAYAALPSPLPGIPGGGTVVCAPGRYLFSSPLMGNKLKPAAFVSASGVRPNRGWGDQQQLGTTVPVFYGQGLSRLFDISTPADATIGYGWQFSGVFFDLTGDIQYGIYSESLNGLRVVDCGAVTRTSTPAVEQYLIRSRVAPAGGDSSWGRVYNCECLGVGLLDGGNTGPSNFNQWVIRDNVVWGFGTLNRAVRIRGGTRCIIADNNFERPDGATPAAEEYILCYSCKSEGNAGEGAINPWLLDNDCRGCYWFPIGLHTGNDAVHTLVSFASGVPYSVYGRYSLRGADWQPLVAPNIRRGYKDPNAFVAGNLGDLFMSFTGNGGGFLFVKTAGDGTVGGWTKVA